ncbi:hypothetical protein [Deinococcus budaensis]|uniref:Flp pilus assembly protein TadB n=1 Tax=Deinococcus budaensis TaxID=1665626 RepID=A0A7W8GIP9_9DEIO|nr:hypothetical protein [Deinococcus budaensis]MBB5236203.1 Flp pilus assembly protein TadB [Deinococcus budaensis]
MFGRRVPPHLVLILSVLLAALCAVLAVRYGLAGNAVAALIWGVLAVWFAVDALRARAWQKK